MATSTAYSVRRQVEKMQPGEIFDYTRFNVDSSEELSLATSLSRLARQGTIVRLAKGKYYKPKETTFGKLRPSESDMVESLTTRNNQRIGYLTGTTVYNSLGLTSQLSNTLVIATSKPLRPKVIEGYRIKYVKRDQEILDQDIPLLQLLDAICDIKNIPDSSPEEALKVLINKVKSITREQKRKIVKLALKYPAGTRALLGAMMETYVPQVSVAKLAGSLNRLSSYDLGLAESILPNKSTWNIK